MTPDPTPPLGAADDALPVIPLAEWVAPLLSDDEVEQLAAAHLNDESGCRAGPCPGENGQGWCDAAMLLVSLRDARAERDASRAREAALRGLLYRAQAWVEVVAEYPDQWVQGEAACDLDEAITAALAAPAAPPVVESKEQTMESCEGCGESSIDVTANEHVELRLSSEGPWYFHDTLCLQRFLDRECQP